MSALYAFARGLAGAVRGLLSTPAGVLYVEPLGRLGQPRQVAAGTSSTSQALTATCTRVSLVAVGCAVRVSVGVGAQTVDANTGHIVLAGERIELEVEAGSHVAAIRDSAATASGTLHVSELL